MYQSLSSRTFNRPVIKIDKVLLKDIIGIDFEVELREPTLYGLHVEHYRPSKSVKSFLMTGEDREEYVKDLQQFFTDDAEFTVTWYDCDRTPTGKPSRRYGAVKQFAVLDLPRNSDAREHGWLKKDGTEREVLTITKDTDLVKLHKYLMEKYSPRYISMYTSSFESAMCGKCEWFVNNINRWFLKGPEETLAVKISMNWDNPRTGAHSERLDFELQNGSYLETYKKLKAARDEAISRYYDSIPSGGYTGD